MRNFAQSLSVFAVAFAAALTPARAAKPQPAEIDALFAKWDKPDSPGCALAVMKGGKIVYKRGYGMANLDWDAKIDPSTEFHVASVSKQFTSFAIVLLERDGKLGVDDDVRKYIPELPDYGKTITLRHLMNHTGGVRDQWDLLVLAGWRMEDVITQEDALGLICRQKELNFEPGAEHLYSNAGYTLLAETVRRVSGKTLREFCEERIFAPLGMTRTHFHDDHGEVVKNRALAYAPATGGKFRIHIPAFDTVGATSLFTTVEDLAQWNENLKDGKVGGAEAVARLLERGKLNDGKTLDYALGISHGSYKGMPTIGHDGADAAYRSSFLRFPEQDFAVALFFNTPMQGRGFITKIADMYLGDQIDAKPEEKPAPQPAGGQEAAARPPEAKPKEPYKPSEAALKEYEGDYFSSEVGSTYQIRARDGLLRWNRIKYGERTLQPRAPDEFAAGWSFKFERGADGNVNAMRINTGRIRGIRFGKMAAAE